MRTISQILAAHDWMGGEYDRPERFIPIIREILSEGYARACEDVAEKARTRLAWMEIANYADALRHKTPDSFL